MKTVAAFGVSTLFFVTLLLASPMRAQAQELEGPAFGSANACALGFNWDHCRQIWREGTRTWCFLVSGNFWVVSGDNVSEGAMIACTASTPKSTAPTSALTKWCGFNVTACDANGWGSFSYMRIWEY